MSKLTTALTEIYESTGLQSSHARRHALILEMQALEGKTIHCFTCPGTCCTGQANSMQITPIEALEILQSLKIDDFSTEELNSFKSKMLETVTNYRLNVEIYTGKRNSQALRKTYTCPFFNNGSLGCGLSRSSKPYGCLGFNPKLQSDNGKACSSNLELLEERDNTFLNLENAANTKIRTLLNLSWSKQNIPQALLDVIERLYT